MSSTPKVRNRYYTVMIVPEKTSLVRRVVVPAWLLKSGAMVVSVAGLVSVIMFMDYWYVMGRIAENKTLQAENRKLRQQVQVYHDKMGSIESTLERVKTFSTRLKVITNIEERTGQLESMRNEHLPDATVNVGTLAPARAPAAPAPATKTPPVPAVVNDVQHADLNAIFDPVAEQAERNALERRFTLLDEKGMTLEKTLHDEYELLADQKSFLAALPARRPAPGYYTSGFGIRKSPFGGHVKMHEGVDIANAAGTPIRAPADGTVIFADIKAGYGQTVVLDHGYGLETLYGHTRKLLVKKGQKVHRGDRIALLGSTGRSTGPHVHYEVHINGMPVDPLSYILED